MPDDPGSTRGRLDRTIASPAISPPVAPAEAGLGATRSTSPIPATVPTGAVTDLQIAEIVR